jgi:2-methylisocitrate lyase-like PEP mutase family enzyme
MRTTAAEKRAAFRALHQSGCFVMPNPWDVGSAVLLEQLGFKALATTSAGMAWSMGRQDGEVSLDETLIHLAALAQASALPLNADFQNAYADAPEAVAANVRLAADTGIAGLSVEDYAGSAERGLYDQSLAVERIIAAREAIGVGGGAVMLTARAEGFVRGRPDLDETIGRLTAFAAAGADCLFAPGLQDEQQISAVVQAVAPTPVNVLTRGPSVASLAALGVRRISVGGALAGVAFGQFLRAAQELAEQGTFGGFAGGVTGRELNPMFAAAAEA